MMSTSGRMALGAIIATSLIAGAFTSAARAQWIPTSGGTYEWAADANWTEAGYPDGQSVAADMGSTNIGGKITVDLNADITLGSLTLGDTDTYQNYIIQAGTTTPGKFIFDNNGSASTLTRVATAKTSTWYLDLDSITADMALKNDLQINDQLGTSYFRIMSNIESMATSGTQFIHATAGYTRIGGDNEADLEGAISDGSTGGKVGIMVSGGALLELWRPNAQFNGEVDNTFTGDVKILDGTLSILDNNWQGARVLADDPNIAIGDTTGSANATFRIAKSGMTQANPITIVGGNTGEAKIEFVGSSQQHVTGPIILDNHDLTVHNLSTQENYARSYITGVVSGTGDITIKSNADSVEPLHVNGPNRVEFDGTEANTYTGTVYVENTTLVLSADDGDTAITGDLHIGAGAALKFGRFGDGDDQIADTGSLYLDDTSWVVMEDSFDTIKALFIGGVQQAAGTYGIGGSGADFSPSQFIGTMNGLLTVLESAGPAVLLGDANNDGVVSADDFAAVQTNFGNTGAADGLLPGDANDDGVVSADDFAAIQTNFGNVLGAATEAAPVPEPATMALLAIGGLAATFRARRRR